MKACKPAFYSPCATVSLSVQAQVGRMSVTLDVVTARHKDGGLVLGPAALCMPWG
jgi:hypothetical protein